MSDFFILWLPGMGIGMFVWAARYISNFKIKTVTTGFVFGSAS